MLRWIVVCVFLWGGCAPAVIGVGATGAYKSVSDERTFSDQVDDATLTARVNAALVESRDVPTLSIDVDTVEGVVSLTGIVANKGVSTNVERVVEGVSGVRGIKNLLQVGASSLGTRVEDTILGMKIKAEFMADSQISAWTIDVDVNNGVVTLSGVVATPLVKEAAIHLANSLVGVVRVVDNLILKKMPPAARE